ncbi:MAG: adenylate/guanylate cyclase domain-containing protein [Myxococcota bacterium]
MADAGVTVERRFAAPRDLVWALLADTNRYDRALGLSPPRYSWRTTDGRRERVAHATQNGVPMSWIEPPYEWVEGHWLSSIRRFLAGPVSEGGLRVEVEGVEGDTGCLARVTAWGDTRSWALRVLGPLVRAHLRRKIEAYLAAAAEVAEAARTTRSTGATEDQPATARLQRLLASVDNEMTSGHRTATDQLELQRRGEQLAQAPVSDAMVKRLVDTLGQRPDEEIAQMRPFELAHHWGQDRRKVLQAFLHGTRAGLVDLNWQVNCPVCRVSAQVVSTLDELGREIHCEGCNIEYGVDFGANVEAVFRCNKAIRPVEPAVYCEASPSFRPHVLAQLRIEPDTTRKIELPLTDGRLHLRTLGTQRALDLLDEAAPEAIELQIDAEAVTGAARGRSTDGHTVLVVRSTLDQPAYLLVERGAWSTDAVLGSIVASQPEFVDLFATEAPAAGLELTIGRITLLFSDLTGSTALYERVGDARAYAIVQEHFRVMERAVARHQGAVIKTMGDAVMASFVNPTRAVAAAIEAVKQTEAQHRDHQIGVKLGIHEGPCLAVRANERLDFFGTTVNLAARLQGQAGAGELVLMHELAEHSAVAKALANAPRRALTAQLKGIAEAQTLVAIDLRPR